MEWKSLSLPRSVLLVGNMVPKLYKNGSEKKQKQYNYGTYFMQLPFLFHRISSY